MPIATITSVNLPTHQYPHVEVNINDNTLRRYTTTAADYGKTLCVFRSPKGPDGVQKITGLEQFVDTYGEGSVEQYGQPLLNARTLAETNAITQYCLRVTADNAIVSNLHIYARYRVKVADTISDTSELNTDIKRVVSGVTTKTITDGITVYTHGTGAASYQYILMSDAGFADDNRYMKITISTEHVDPEDPTSDTVVVATVGTEATDRDQSTDDIKKMQVYFVAKTSTDLTNANDLASDPDHYYDEVKSVHGATIQTYDPTVDDVPDADGYDTYWKEVRLMTVTALGKGVCGNQISFNIISDPNRDKSNDYKNYWVQIYEGAKLIEKFAVTLTSNGKVRGDSKYICNVINNDDNTNESSSVLRVDFNESGLKWIYDVYNTKISPATITYDIFDAIFGLDKRLVANRAIPDNMKGIDGYQIVEAPDGAIYDNDEEFLPAAFGGTNLRSGDDGDFTSETEAAIKDKVNQAYYDVFHGKTITKEVFYKTIDTVILQVAQEVNGRKILVDGDEKTIPTGLNLYFDKNSNYLLHLVTKTEDPTTHEITYTVMTDVDGNPIMDLTPAQKANNEYIIVSKIGNKIYIPPIESWSGGLTPEKVTTEYQYPEILSKNKTEIDFFLDANYDYDTKIAICDWVNTYRREDFVVYLDAGVSDTLISNVDGYTWVQAFDEATNGDESGKYWYYSIDAYYGRIKDPYNYKVVEVTSTYNLARHLVPHWAANGGKHIPYAGSLYAVIDSYLPKSVFPLMDEGLDSEHMDRFIEEHVNYAQVNSRGDVIRATQSTRYPILGDAFTLSNLTELNNVHIVLDIKKDVEHVLELFTYQFNEPSDLKRFNTIVSSSILPKYAAAQVKSISATFNRTSEEAEYGILHLYIEVVHKNLVKIIMVDIDVNRNTD